MPFTGSHYLEDNSIQLARGLIKGAAPINLFGTTNGLAHITTTEFRTAWELPQDYVFPAVQATMDISSDDASDSSINIKIIGLDDQYHEISDVITLDGTNVVESNIPFFRINAALTLNSNPVGNITITDSASVVSYIKAGDGRDQKSIYTVPFNKAFYLMRIDAFATDANGGKAAQFRNKITTETGQTFRVGATTFFDHMPVQRAVPYRYAPMTDINMQLKSLSGAVYGAVFGEGITIKE